MTRAFPLFALLAVSAVGVSAQPAAVPDDPAAFAALDGLSGDAPPPDSAAADVRDAYGRAAALRQSDPGFTGNRVPLPSEGPALAFEWTDGGDRRVAVVNPGDVPAFVPLSGEGVPAPLVPVFVSRADAGPVPSLVALLDDHRAVYGLRVPPRATVAYRPAAPSDVRPRGLDE